MQRTHNFNLQKGESMKKQILAVIATISILATFIACSDRVNTPGDGTSEQSSQIDSESSPSESGSDTSDLKNSANSEDMASLEYEYRQEHCLDKTVKQRGIYGETEIPDIHYEDADPDGSTAHSPFGGDWEYIGIGSMEFESHTFGDYTIKLVGKYVRTDKEHFPDRIFASSLLVEVERDGVKLSEDGYYTCPILDLGPQYYPEFTILTDKIGSYLDFYDLVYPVIAMRYYYNDDSKWDSKLDRSVDFSVVIGDKCLSGFGCMCEPGCGRYFDTNSEKFIINKGFTTCKTAVFEDDKFKVIDKNTLFDEEAGITYAFKFSDPPQFALYTAEKNVGSIAAASKEDWIDSPFRY